ncbi:putative inner membrane transmembrane protein [Verminephrobacter eiseniae EF01-2]|uniref:Putative inner membrane transmembrane protein n=1 Tax=Verminephrobacter eiseniae (strain EF01-2) TaxID=391735 RepID=A1WDU8_VEREI|nr:putative inner membrane transmembrane protein [Verminephrobacter eiseniae EF01-2]
MRIARSFRPLVFAPSSRRPRHGAHRPVTPPTPAIVTQQAVSPLPRWALLLLCSAYVVPGFVGREPWKSADITAFGYMLALARGQTPWFGPLLGGMPPESESLLPYWLGAWALQLAPPWLSAELAARIPFAALLLVTLLATWYGTYYLARSPGAQPVAFAFGGEANPPDYARAMADGALLALIACLGLAQLSHEMSSHLAQLGCVALLFFALAAMPHRRWASALALVLGMFGLTLSGAPALAALLGVGSMVLVLHAPGDQSGRRLRWVLALAAVTLAAALLAWGLHCWRWRIVSADAVGKEWQSLARLLLWFGWPAWPLALWTVWRWRRQILSRQGHRHLLLPLWFCALSLAAAITTRPADRALLPGLPALAALAAFALPTLRRSVGALIDWFTLLFFSASALAIWVIWIAMQTGFPAKPAANVAKLAPDFVPQFSALALAPALAATALWCLLVWWRAARDRAPIWKSLVLPASGATLGWLLLMTLWLPLLDHARSYGPQVRSVVAALGPAPGCIETLGLHRGQVAALQYHGRLALQPAGGADACQWLLADGAAWPVSGRMVDAGLWEFEAILPRPTDNNDHLLLFHRLAAARGTDGPRGSEGADEPDGPDGPPRGR